MIACHFNHAIDDSDRFLMGIETRVDEAGNSGMLRVLVDYVVVTKIDLAANELTPRGCILSPVETSTIN
jgi:hypothetical protein